MVFVIIVYDVAVERQNKIREFLRRFLDHVQNSVFEGEITESTLFYIEKRIKELIDENNDSIIIYVLQNKNLVERKIEIGKRKDLIFY
ncbi:MAG: CRISPR-associated endonuclease Cas2 [Candidatus Aenigmatarchaeota archaeon]